jgi:hypothetical protein
LKVSENRMLRKFEPKRVESILTLGKAACSDSTQSTVRVKGQMLRLSKAEETRKLKSKLRKQTIPTERPPLVGEVSANF